MLLRYLIVLVAIAAMFCTSQIHADVDILNSMEQALMPGDLNKAHEKYADDCTNCHKFFGKSFQNDLCLKCHDHKNVREDIAKGKGYHGRIPDIKTRLCKSCHREHIGRDATMTLFDKQTFNHDATDFVLRDRHQNLACKKCHKKDKEYHQAPTRCYDCHKDDEPHNGKLGKQCNSCHIEKSWTNFRFDHSQTRFALKGKHKAVLCRDCHPQERYQNLPRKCFGCHRNDDKHEGKFDQKCEKCHNVSGWINRKFNHDKDTDFKITGNHKRLSCEQCHKENPYEKELKTDCYSCHRHDDDHKGLYGKKCKDCHNTKSWRKSRFDHDKTDFPLKGKHKDVDCKDCHPGELSDEVPSNCHGCHKADDPHEGKQGKKCENCHNASGWLQKVQFDHGITRFPLLGAHAALACEECHESSNFKEAKHRCNACHAGDDPHRSRLGPRCQQCHFSNDWKAWQFDHDKETDFALENAHKRIVCEACHRVAITDEISLSKQCYGCHSQDDIHDGGFGRNCGRCHKADTFSEVDI